MMVAPNCNNPKGHQIFDSRDQQNWQEGCYGMKETDFKVGRMVGVPKMQSLLYMKEEWELMLLGVI